MDLLENEIAKQIEGFPRYYVTNFGRIWSTYSNKWLSLTVSQRGNHKRQYVSLGRGNKFYVHQLVAKAFVPNPNNYTEVDHIDTNGLNNRADNLRWVTHQKNMENTQTQENIKQNTGYLIEIEYIPTGEKTWGRIQTAEKYGVSKETITKHLHNRVAEPKWKVTGNKKRPEEVDQNHN